MKYLIGVIALVQLSFVQAQDVVETFNGTRVLNGHSVETLPARTMQFRIEHRFGDMIPGWDASLLAQNWLGFDQASDIRFAFEYGITDQLMVGLGRSKGTGAPYSSLVDGFAKYRILHQNKEKGMPISMTAILASTVTYMKAFEDESFIQHFPKFAHRFAYTSQINIARKFGDRVSISLMPTYVHRNYVAADDVNGVFSLGGAAGFKVTKNFGLITEYYHNFHSQNVRPDKFNSLSAGFEFITNGHNFKIVLTNAEGFTESQFVTNTISDWSNGEFRLGFSITRNFKL